MIHYGFAGFENLSIDNLRNALVAIAIRDCYGYYKISKFVIFLELLCASYKGCIKKNVSLNS